MVSVFENKSYSFVVKLPSTGYILSLLRKEESIIINGKVISREYINIYDLFELARLKFPSYPFSKSIPIIMGSINSANIYVKLK